MDVKRFMILLTPVIVGTGAGVWGAWEIVGDDLRILAVKLAMIGIAALLAIYIVSRLTRDPKRSEYQRPKITGARFAAGVGELTIEAGHAKDLEVLNLPPTWIARTVRPNQVYTVEFRTQSKERVSQVARENGYSGKVG
jgi:hypothetical protein